MEPGTIQEIAENRKSNRFLSKSDLGRATRCAKPVLKPNPGRRLQRGDCAEIYQDHSQNKVRAQFGATSCHYPPHIDQFWQFMAEEWPSLTTCWPKLVHIGLVPSLAADILGQRLLQNGVVLVCFCASLGEGDALVHVLRLSPPALNPCSSGVFLQVRLPAISQALLGSTSSKSNGRAPRADKVVVMLMAPRTHHGSFKPRHRSNVAWKNMPSSRRRPLCTWVVKRPSFSKHTHGGLNLGPAARNGSSKHTEERHREA